MTYWCLRIDEKGRVELPAYWLEKVGLRPGDDVYLGEDTQKLGKEPKDVV